MPRYFTLVEARQYLPAVGQAIREAIEARKVLAKAEREQRMLAERVMLMGGLTVNHQAALENHQKRENNSARLKKSLETFEEIGCLVKDLEIGLIDFPALYRGREVYLCWRLGESDIEFWHAVEEGFAGRKPIDRDFLKECG
jgi:hypothetical protein